MSAEPKLLMDCIIIGGCANGTLLRAIDASAELIELRRPEGIKPLVSQTQAMPEIMHEKDRYEVHPIGLTDDYDDLMNMKVFGIGIIEGKSIAWGFSQLVKSHVQFTALKLSEAGVVTKN